MKERIARSAGCDQFDAELAAYLEGESRPQVVAHARQCGYCAATLSDLEQIRMSARELPWEEPSPAVWANLRAALEAEDAFRVPGDRWAWLGHLGLLRHPAPVGALASLAILGTLFTLSPARLEPVRTSEAGLVAGLGENAPAVMSVDEAAWARTIHELEDTYRAREPFLEPELKVTYRQSLDSLNGSIRECLTSLQAEPTNTLARDYLLDAYSQKAELLTSAIEFSGR